MKRKKVVSSKSSSGSAREFLRLSVRQLVDKYAFLIDLESDYQREKVWSRKDQEQLLDSILRDIDIPKLYLARVRNSREFDYECIDGKQRLLTLSQFLSPKSGDGAPLKVEILNKFYTYSQLKTSFPDIQKQFDDYKLDFVIYEEASLNEEFIRLIFRRLQLGIRLNSGELLNSLLGSIREFVFKEIGKDGPFLRLTRLSDKRYSRQFALAQMCINSFSRSREESFRRARLDDLESFFGEESDLSNRDENLVRIRKVLKAMDDGFGDAAACISSRAGAVSAYLFCEELVRVKRQGKIPSFAKFYSLLLSGIEADMKLMSDYKQPKNRRVLEDFQKYILQASVEPYAIKRRDDFLREAFSYYSAAATKGKIVGAPR